MIGLMILKIMTTLGIDSFSNICFMVCSKTENGIRRSNFLRTCNVPCVWNNFYVGIAYVVAGDCGNYPISHR